MPSNTSSSMSKLDLKVIDDQLLLGGIRGKGKLAENINEESSIVEVAPIAESLILSYQSICKIENLVGFDNLTKLCLDNNAIEKIGNISHLKQLRWLDLSFNKIRKVQGLEELKNLEDLSLYCNKITEIEGFDSCPKLQCISLGRNRIDSTDQVIKLRQLRALKMINLAGNPVCKEAEYRMTVLAYVSQIMYLDYALISREDFDAAREQFHDELLDVEEKESVAAEKETRDIALGKFVAQLDEAGILFAHSLITDMFAEDAEVERLKHLPGVKETIEQFKTAFKTHAEEFIKQALEKHDVRVKNINAFDAAVSTMRDNDDSDSRMLIENFNKSKKTAMAVFGTRAERNATVEALTEELERVCDELMSIEVRQVEKFDAMVDEFDNVMLEKKSKAIDFQQTFFRAVEEFEEKFSNSVKSVALDLIDRLAKEELPEDYLDDEAMSLVMDKDVCLQSVSSSHDIHVSKLLKAEDTGRALETKRYQDLIHSYTSNALKRNRDRVLQVHAFSKSTKHHLAAFLKMDDGEDEEL